MGYMSIRDFLPKNIFIEGAGMVSTIPIYEFVIAKISIILNSDPLVVVRFFNAICWILLFV